MTLFSLKVSITFFAQVEESSGVSCCKTNSTARGSGSEEACGNVK